MNTKSILVLGIYCLSLVSVVAQSIIPVSSTIKHKKTEKPCIEVVLESEPKELKKEWRDYIKSKYDIKMDGIGFLKNKDVLSAKEVNFTAISEKAMDFYTFIDEQDGGSVMKVFGCFGYDYCISEKGMPQEYQAMRQVLQGFLKEYLPKFYNGYLEEGREEIKDLEKDCRKADKSIEDSEKRIEDLNKKIEDAKEYLKERKDMLENARIRLKAREEKYNLIRSQLDRL